MIELICLLKVKCRGPKHGERLDVLTAIAKVLDSKNASNVVTMKIKTS